MAEATLVRGLSIAATASPATTIYDNTSGAALNKLVLRLTQDAGQTGFTFVNVYIRSTAADTVADTDLDCQADVPPNGRVDIPIPTLANNDQVCATAETANIVNATLYEVNP